MSYDLGELEVRLEDYSSDRMLAFFNHDCFGEPLDFKPGIENISDLINDKDLLPFLRKKRKAIKEEYGESSYEFRIISRMLSSFSAIMQTDDTRVIREHFSNLLLQTADIDGEEMSYWTMFENRFKDEFKDQWDSYDEELIRFFREEYTPAFFELVKIRNKTARKKGYKNLAEGYGFFEDDFEKVKFLHDGALKDYLGIKDQVIPMPDFELIKSPLETALATYRTFGFDIPSMENITIETEIREGKHQRVSVYPIRIPDDVRCTLYLSGDDLDSCSTALHELGHILHFAFTDKSLNFMLRNIANPTLTESYAFIFDHLRLNPIWLEENTTLTADQADIVSLYQKKDVLRAIGRCTRRFLMGLELYVKRNTGRRLFKRLHKAWNDEKVWDILDAGYLYYEAGEDPFYGFDHAWGIVLGGCFTHYLQENFGETWFRNEDAGRFLEGLWSFGFSKRPEEICKMIGLPIDAEEQYEMFREVYLQQKA